MPSEAVPLERNMAQRIPSWPGANDTPKKAEYICADQTAHLISRMQKRGGQYIRSALDSYRSGTQSDRFFAQRIAVARSVLCPS
jgi:hypothetical protein